ncbi:MAG: Zn-dependent hydrolase [Candidatus Tectimicrobiota bacterium]|nr:MAG: Zn-dependent hydrolase [Candidatus Tectomicrobia bacterium]
MAGEREAAALAAAIDEARLWQRHLDMARLGATPGGGVNRQAFSPADGEARRLLIRWAQELGLAASLDPIGNLFIRRPGREPQAEPVLTGSHLDSQPTGGKFDGAYGVLAGFEVLEAMQRCGMETRRPVELVVWSNEEGSRFQPACMGSVAFIGARPLAELLAARDWEGMTAGEALEAMLATLAEVPRRPLGFPVAAYLEAHIEQGPLLEAAGVPIGVVTGVQGLHRYLVEVVGEAAHAGTTPLRQRKDALKAAVSMIHALEGVMADATDTVRFTVGRFDVAPGSPNVVPSRVRFTIDLRHPEAEVLARLGGQIGPLCQAHARGCAVTVTRLSAVPPTRFHPRIVSLVRHWATALGLPHRELLSGAGHDAMHLAAVCPAGMIFVPCAGGISHNEAESARPADLAAGARVLAACLAELAAT